MKITTIENDINDIL